MEDAESTEQDKDNINKDKTKEETVMDTSELYQISDGDTGKQVADGLKQNFDVLGAAIPDDNTILEKSGYRVDMAALMGDSPASATISDAIGGWDNLVAAINAKMVIIGYKEGVFTTAVHAEIMESTKIIIAVHSENVAMKFSIVNSGGTLSLTRTNTELALKSDLAVLTNVPELTAAYTIPANATTQEKIYQIAIGATVYEVTGAEGIVWQNGVAPVVEANSTLVVSVINNLAVWGTFKA